LRLLHVVVVTIARRGDEDVGKNFFPQTIKNMDTNTYFLDYNLNDIYDMSADTLDNLRFDTWVQFTSSTERLDAAITRLEELLLGLDLRERSRLAVQDRLASLRPIPDMNHSLDEIRTYARGVRRGVISYLNFHLRGEFTPGEYEEFSVTIAEIHKCLAEMLQAYEIRHTIDSENLIQQAQQREADLRRVFGEFLPEEITLDEIIPYLSGRISSSSSASSRGSRGSRGSSRGSRGSRASSRGSRASSRGSRGSRG